MHLVAFALQLCAQVAHNQDAVYGRCALKAPDATSAHVSLLPPAAAHSASDQLRQSILDGMTNADVSIVQLSNKLARMILAWPQANFSQKVCCALLMEQAHQVSARDTALNPVAHDTGIAQSIRHVVPAHQMSGDGFSPGLLDAQMLHVSRIFVCVSCCALIGIPHQSLEYAPEPRLTNRKRRMYAKGIGQERD